MKIAFTGAKNIRRVVRQFEWCRDNGHVAEIDDARLCAELLTSPHGDFVVAQDEPLLMIGISASDIAALALLGIASAAELAALNKAGITALAGETGQGVKQIRAWVTRAKQTLMEA